MRVTDKRGLNAVYSHPAISSLAGRITETPLLLHLRRHRYDAEGLTNNRSTKGLAPKLSPLASAIGLEKRNL